jgi:putative ABC transport system permease protein
MLKNYFKIAIRHLLKYKSYSAINIAGLAVGIACAILLTLFIQHELSYDRYHENAARLFRIVRAESASTAFRLASALNLEYTEIQAMRFRRDREPALIKHGDKQFYEQRMFWADAEVLQNFSLRKKSACAKSPARSAASSFSNFSAKRLSFRCSPHSSLCFSLN